MAKHYTLDIPVNIPVPQPAIDVEAPTIRVIRRVFETSAEGVHTAKVVMARYDASGNQIGEAIGPFMVELPASWDGKIDALDESIFAWSESQGHIGEGSFGTE